MILYETFSEACPYEYQYPYDDHAGSFNCQTDITSPVTVTFGLSGPTTTATLTATDDFVATATATSGRLRPLPTLTPTATATLQRGYPHRHLLGDFNRDTYSDSYS